MSKGIDKPTENWTRFPNCILDNLEKYTGNELKVLALMIRKTMGFRDKANKKFAAKYVAVKLDISEKTAWECMLNLEARGSIRCIGREWHGLKLYEIVWRKASDVERKKSRSRRTVKITVQNRSVKVTGLAQKNLPTVLDNHNTKENQSAAAWLVKNDYGKETKTKVNKAIDLSPIEPVLKILREENKHADKSISINLRNRIRDEIEANGEEYVCNAVRGRIAQAKATGKELWLTAFFDPDRAEWRATCASIGEAQQNAAQGLESGFKSTLPDFSHIKYDDAPIDEEAWQTLTGSKN